MERTHGSNKMGSRDRDLGPVRGIEDTIDQDSDGRTAGPGIETSRRAKSKKEWKELGKCNQT